MSQYKQPYNFEEEEAHFIPATVPPLHDQRWTTTKPPVFSHRARTTQRQNESYFTSIIPMTIGILLLGMDGNLVESTYTSIGNELNQLQSISWIPTACMLTLTSFQPLAGKLSDIFGRKTCLLMSYAIYTFGCLLFGLSTSITQLIVARAIEGIGGGGMSILVTIIVSDIVPLRARGTWQGVISMVSTIGSTIGAPLGGFFADHIGWRWAFLLQVPLGVIAFVSVLFTLRLPTPKSSTLSENIKRIDIGGATTLVFAIFFLLVGLDRGGNISWSDWLTASSLVASAVFATLFVYIEVSIASEPFAPARIVSNRSLLPCYITGFFGAPASATLVFYVPLFYQAVEGKTASESSIWLITNVIASLAGTVLSGYIMQRTGKYYTTTVVSYFLVLVGTGIVFLSSGAFVVSTIGVAIGMALTEFGNSSGLNTILTALIANAGQADQAVVTAVSFLFRSLGSVIGIAVGSTLVQDTLRYSLHEGLSGDGAEEIVTRVRQSLSYLSQLDPITKGTVVQSYEDAIQVNFLFSVTLAALAAVSSLFIKERPLTRASS
ncbi:hypothetical protein APHAL10511_000759 [Amanita phalloides]|nr:hypothetical protein APHAL10511_000759 [Amanita phalloides]